MWIDTVYREEPGARHGQSERHREVARGWRKQISSLEMRLLLRAVTSEQKQ